jgi:hypothetical protein
MLSDEVKALEDKCIALESMLFIRNGDLEKALTQVEKIQEKFKQLKRDYVLRMIEGFLKVIDEGYYVGKKEEETKLS